MQIKDSFTENINDNKFRIILVYILLISVSLLTLIGVNLFFVSNSIDEKNDTFSQQTAEIHQHLIQVTQSTHFILDGFSALLSGVGFTNYNTVVKYSEEVLNRVPHIYQIQAAQYVKRENLKAFNSDQEMFADFQVKVFDGAGLVNAEQTESDIFYPITFFADKEQAPFSNIGLDVLSVPFLASATYQAAASRKTIISEPFDTIDEQRVFVMVQPAFFESESEPDFFIFFIIKSEILLPKSAQNSEFSVSIRIKEHNEFLFEKAAPRLNSSHWLLPKFTYKNEVLIGAQSIELSISQQMLWSSININLLSSIWAASALVFVLFFFMFKLHFRAEMEKMKQSVLLYEMATYDSLTGLANRRHFSESLKHAVNLAQRNKHQLGVLFLDLDGFKQINDTFGHDIGDEALMLAAQKIKSALRDVDVIGRLGGDEFAVLLVDVEDFHGCELVELRIKDAISSIERIGEYKVDLGVSIGIALYPNDAKTGEQLLNIADENMYQDKHKRKLNQ